MRLDGGLENRRGDVPDFEISNIQRIFRVRFAAPTNP
jgi:hypothetical protein